jgi:hypothetical protein
MKISIKPLNHRGGGNLNDMSAFINRRTYHEGGKASIKLQDFTVKSMSAGPSGMSYSRLTREFAVLAGSYQWKSQLR